ncbi:MAG: CCA tRNA nucleotidyltransferase [Eubacterium sp.]
MNLPTDAKKLIDLLIGSGYSAYAVGGCVRDYLMGRECGDIDITTSATPQQVESVLNSNGIRYVETGIKHGTVTAIVSCEPYEITTFRTDGDYADNRHPDNVSFVTIIEDDLSRRDFTINAMAYNDNVGVVDIFGGREDLESHLIRCVGDADTRFKEDALRIMRALRFASVLGFDIESDTAAVILDNKELLQNIAAERVFVELKKLLVGQNVEAVLTDYRDVFGVIIPELKPTFDFQQYSKWHLYDIYTHTVKSVAYAPAVDYIRLALLLHDIGKPYTLKIDEKGDHFKGHPAKSKELAHNVLKRLKVSNDIYKKVITLVEIHDKHIHLNPQSIKYWLSRLGEELIYDFVDVKIADMSSHNLALAQHEMDELCAIRDMIGDVIASGEPYTLAGLNIHGNHLIDLGYKGKDIAEELQRLLDIVIKAPSKNTRDILLGIAAKDKEKQ